MFIRKVVLRTGTSCSCMRWWWCWGVGWLVWIFAKLLDILAGNVMKSHRQGGMLWKAIGRGMLLCVVLSLRLARTIDWTRESLFGFRLQVLGVRREAWQPFYYCWRWWWTNRSIYSRIWDSEFQPIYFDDLRMFVWTDDPGIRCWLEGFPTYF